LRSFRPRRFSGFRNIARIHERAAQGSCAAEISLEGCCRFPRLFSAGHGFATKPPGLAWRIRNMEHHAGIPRDRRPTETQPEKNSSRV
jgi:hypothetical protein